MRRWSTHDVSPQDRFDFWNSAICEAVLNVEARSAARNDFRAEISANQYGSGHFVSFRSEPHKIERSRRLVRTKPDESYLVSLQLAGSCRVRQGEARFELNAGEIGIVSAARPMELELVGEVSRRVAVLPRTTVEAAGSWLSPDAARRIPAGASSRILGRLMQELSDPDASLAAGEEAALMRSLLDLLSASGGDGSASRDGAAALHQRVMAYLEQNLADPALTPVAVANAVGIAERTLHAHFASTGTTCMRWIMERRLERAAAALRSRSWSDTSVTEIAFRQGFNDAAHFSRRFKKAYGCSPVQYRGGRDACS